MGDAQNIEHLVIIVKLPRSNVDTKNRRAEDASIRSSSVYMAFRVAWDDHEQRLLRKI